MLNLVHQNGLQKLGVESYFIEPREIKGSQDKVENKQVGPEIAYAIVGVGPAIGWVDVAQYDSLENARKVFYTMVRCEALNICCQLPLDEEKEIKNFGQNIE